MFKAFSTPAAVLCALLATSLAVARADEAPILMVDPGGHMALIRAVVFTPDGTQIVSAADDKVIRVWDIETASTVRTLRGQIGDGNRGKIYALALSPDGRYLAAGGRIVEAGEGTHPIRIYDFKTGEMVAVLSGHNDAVLSLDFAPDGKFLVSGSTDDTAIIWDFATRRALHRLRLHAGDINRAVFTGDGERVVTGSDDRTLGLWSVKDGKLLARSSPHAGNVFGVAASPATGLIASSAQGGEVRLSDDRTLKPVRTFDRQKGDLLGLSFSADGKYLVTGSGTKPYRCLVWDVASGAPVRAYAGHDHLVVATATSPAGQLAATAGGSNNEIHLWDMTTGTVLKTLRGAGQSVWATGFSADGSLLAWGHTHRESSPIDRGPIEFTLRLPEQQSTTGEPRPVQGKKTRFRRGAAESEKIKLTRRLGGDYGYDANLEIAQRGRVVATIVRDERSGFAHNSYTLTPDATEAITGGGNGWLTAFDVTGEKRGDFIGHTSDIWATSVSPDGRLLLSGSDDQTVRLWNVATRENVISLFHSRDGEWVMWTPQGYYAASPRGDGYVGWQINQGEGKSARFVTAAQLKQHFYRPDIIRRALELASARQAIDEAQRTNFSLDQLITRKPPGFSGVTPAPGEAVGTSPTDLTLRVEANADPVEGFDITINGRRVVSRAGPDQPPKDAGEHEVNFKVPLSAGPNIIDIVAYNAVGKTALQIPVQHSGQPDLDKRGTLYILSIGIDNYINFADAKLDFAEIDARTLKAAIEIGGGALHNAMESRLLATGASEQPTAANIRSALTQLGAAGPRDTVVLFLAGHGLNEGADYFYMANDTGVDAQGKLNPDTAISWRDLQHAIETTHGERILIVDTCYSGNAYNARLIKDAADDNLVVLAATDAETLAHEEPSLGHGVFTYSILQGLSGAADSGKDGRIQLGELSDFVRQLVVRLTKGEQTPTAYMSSGRYFVVAGPRAGEPSPKASTTSSP